MVFTWSLLQGQLDSGRDESSKGSFIPMIDTWVGMVGKLEGSEASLFPSGISTWLDWTSSQHGIGHDFLHGGWFPVEQVFEEAQVASTSHLVIFTV